MEHFTSEMHKGTKTKKTFALLSPFCSEGKQACPICTIKTLEYCPFCKKAVPLQRLSERRGCRKTPKDI